MTSFANIPFKSRTIIYLLKLEVFCPTRVSVPHIRIVAFWGSYSALCSSICFIYSKWSLSSISLWDLPEHIWLLWWQKPGLSLRRISIVVYCFADSATCCDYWVAIYATVSAYLMLCFLAFTSRVHYLHFWNFCFLKFYIFLSCCSFNFLQSSW